MRIRDGDRRIEARGCPPRMRQEGIEHILRAVLWRMSMGDDPTTVAEWDRWIREQALAARSWGARRPSAVSPGEVLTTCEIA